MTANTESKLEETRTAPKESRKLQFRTMDSFEEEYCSEDESNEGYSERSNGSAIAPTSYRKQSSGLKGVGFNLQANTVHHHNDCPKHKKKTKEHWYTPSEVDDFRDHYIKGVARQSSRSEESKRKEAMSKSKAIVIYNQKNLCPIQLAEMYKEHSERSQDQAKKTAASHQDEVKEILQRAPKKKSNMKKLFKRLSSMTG